jgi:hypothetical protein
MEEDRAVDSIISFNPGTEASIEYEPGYPDKGFSLYSFSCLLFRMYTMLVILPRLNCTLGLHIGGPFPLYRFSFKSNKSMLIPKVVGPSTTLAWPGWK